MDDRTSPRHLARNDLDRFRLRNFIEELGDDELDVRNDPVDVADVAAILHGNPKAVWFRNINGSTLQLAGNVVGSRSRLARAFGGAPDKIIPEVPRRPSLAPQLSELHQAPAPAQEVGHLGEHADLTHLPAHLQHGLDGAPYISASIDYCVDPATGKTNSGMRRLMLRGPHEAGVDLNAPSDLRAIYQASAVRGEKLPVSFVIGAHPMDTVSATMHIPDEDIG